MSKTFRKKDISDKFYHIEYLHFSRKRTLSKIINGENFQKFLTINYLRNKTDIEKNSTEWKKEYALAHKDKVDDNAPKHFRVTLERKFRRKSKNFTYKAMHNLESDFVHPKLVKNANWNWF